MGPRVNVMGEQRTRRGWVGCVGYVAGVPAVCSAPPDTHRRTAWRIATGFRRLPYRAFSSWCRRPAIGTCAACLHFLLFTTRAAAGRWRPLAPLPPGMPWNRYIDVIPQHWGRHAPTGIRCHTRLRAYLTERLLRQILLSVPFANACITPLPARRVAPSPRTLNSCVH